MLKRALSLSVLGSLLMYGHLLAQTPAVISVFPPQNKLNVPVSSILSVTFDIEMDEATIDSSTFVVNARLTGLHKGMISYDSQTKTATLDPDSDFDVGEVVTAVLTTGIQSFQGFPLNSSFVWSFTTATDDGPGTFGRGPTCTVGGFPRTIFAADLDGDEDIDLVTANESSDDVSVLLNIGDGSFDTQSVYPVGDGPCCVLAADLDADGDLDLATANWYSSDVSILLNAGNGTFSSHLVYAANAYPHFVFAADVDGDGDLDLAVANHMHACVSVLLNNGDGTFTSASNYLIGDNGPVSIYAADFDSDGDLDLATANYRLEENSSLSVLVNNGIGTFVADSVYPIVENPRSVFAADLNGDGNLDLTTANQNTDNISLLLNHGNGTFASSLYYSCGTQPYSILAADVDGDDDLDLLVANQWSSDISVLLNNGDGAFATQSLYPGGDNPWSLVAADLDGDGDLDIATAPWNSSTVSVLLNCLDSDGDFICDDRDNCLDTPNPDQEDQDADGVGDSCDNCLAHFNPNQEDADSDEVGDSCDVCPFHATDDCCNPIGSNLAPEVISPQADTVHPGAHFDYIAVAMDPNCDGSDLTLVFSDYPSWCTVQGDSLVGTVAYDCAATSFKVIASDGELADTLQVLLIMSNQSPEILDSDDTVTVRNQDAFSYYPTVDDSDDTVHTVAYLAYPHWCFTRNDSVLGIAPDTLFAETLTVTVEDYCDADTLSFVITIYLCGDADRSGMIDIDDVVFLISYIFSGGPPPAPYDQGDADCSGSIDIDDVVYLINYIFAGGPSPCVDCE
ncbi:MAG: FG-GAP-like repeat-containing protein [Candidatus Zixiibacteriota bacterium]